AIGAVLPIALLVAWQAIGSTVRNPRMPLPSKVIAGLAEMIAAGELPIAIVQSLGRVFAGFAVAALIAIPLGLAMGHFRAAERNVDPLVESFRPVAAIRI